MLPSVSVPLFKTKNNLTTQQGDRQREMKRGGGGYLRLTGECHATDRDAAKDAVPANVNDPVEPQATEEAVFEGGEHHLWWRGEQQGYSTSHKEKERPRKKVGKRTLTRRPVERKETPSSKEKL